MDLVWCERCEQPAYLDDLMEHNGKMVCEQCDHAIYGDGCDCNECGSRAESAYERSLGCDIETLQERYEKAYAERKRLG